MNHHISGISGLGRRDFLYGALALSGLLSGCDRAQRLDVQQAKQPASPTPPDESSEPTAALSLAALQKSSSRSRSNSQALLPGINRISGFVAEAGGIDYVPVNEAFLWAVKQNSVYYAARQGTGRYTSPLFRLVQCLKSHPDLKDCAANEALQQLTNECKPDWGGLFPEVPIPSLEFVTAWEQVNFPTGTSPWEVVRQSIMKEPLLLIAKPTCEDMNTIWTSALARSDPTLLAKSDPPHRYALVPGLPAATGERRKRATVSR